MVAYFTCTDEFVEDPEDGATDLSFSNPVLGKTTVSGGVVSEAGDLIQCSFMPPSDSL
jgi:hypothetical protein